MSTIPKVVILAGGYGSRLAEETEVRPKPLVEIGGHPILWHIMKHYSHFGFHEFFVALGYKGDHIKRYFLDYYSLTGSMTLELSTGKTELHGGHGEDWILHLMDTGLATNTGGRLHRLELLLKQATFMVTYGDGVSDVNLCDLLRFHRAHGRLATVTAVRPPARFGGLVFNGDQVTEFTEKPQVGEGWINGGFLVLEPGALEYLHCDEDSLEIHCLERLARDKQLMAFRHDRFWQCMDTVRDVRFLEKLWTSGNAPWKLWE
jgi:glucose-1-phosphate cytidylyltransferase